MEILKSGDVPVLMTNLEVKCHLEGRMKERAERQKVLGVNISDIDANEGADYGDQVQKQCATLRDRDWIETNILSYISMTPCAIMQIKPSMDEVVHKLKTVEGFGLTDAETLQILNHLPTEVVELHLLIEDLPSRLTEERQEELLRCVSQLK
mmetsp:Transcript_12450/g.27418  ORF Transcript_12450/g.27418 Transcript_12450/m.27418 type:complete len:152 (-) Transcript_12450:772-1227(-)